MRSEDKEITTLLKKAKSIENEVEESRQKARNCVWFILQLFLLTKLAFFVIKSEQLKNAANYTKNISNEISEICDLLNQKEDEFKQKEEFEKERISK